MCNGYYRQGAFVAIDHIACTFIPFVMIFFFIVRLVFLPSYLYIFQPFLLPRVKSYQPNHLSFSLYLHRMKIEEEPHPIHIEIKWYFVLKETYKCRFCGQSLKRRGKTRSVFSSLNWEHFSRKKNWSFKDITISSHKCVSKCFIDWMKMRRRRTTVKREYQWMRYFIFEELHELTYVKKEITDNNLYTENLFFFFVCMFKYRWMVLIMMNFWQFSNINLKFKVFIVQ